MAKCPACGTEGAKKFLWMVKCVNKTCAKFDMEHFMDSGSLHAPASAPPPAPSPVPSAVAKGPNDVEIRYRNCEGKENTYVGD